MTLERNIYPYVSIVFPNFNGGDFITKAIDSVMALNYPDECFELVIVDNNSSDNSVKMIKEKYSPFLDSKKIKLIKLSSNVGAPCAYNKGIGNSKREYGYILKLDNDVILDRNSLKEMIKCAEQDNTTGIVGGKVFYFSDKKRLHLVGSKISPFYAGGRGIGKFKLDTEAYNKNLELDAVNGCMMLVKRRLIDEIGLMDESYFLYYDDLDWSLSASRNSFKSIYCAKAVAFHNTSFPNKRFQSKTWLYYAVFNSFYFMQKNYKGLSRIVFFVAIHLRVLMWVHGILFNNDISKYPALFKTVSTAYLKGIKRLFKKNIPFSLL